MSESQKDRVQLSCRFERARVQQIVTEADLEKAAEDAKASEAAPFEEVLPVASGSLSEPAKAETFQASRELNPASNLGDANPSILAQLASWLFVTMPLALFVNQGAFWLWKNCTFEEVPISFRLPFCFGVGLIFGCFNKSITIILSHLFSGFGGLITSTALGAWIATQNIACGIGYAIYGIGIAYYYVAGHMLVPSVCLKNVCQNYTGEGLGAEALAGAHALGIGASVLVVLMDWGTQWTDKLIFGWWAFYVLNIFCFIGRELSSKNKVSG